MKIKIADSYANAFITTQKGFVIRKNEIKEADLEDVELKALMEQGLLVIVKEEKMEEKKIIKDTVPDKTVKEVISEDNDVKENLKESEEESSEDFIEE